MKHWRSVLLNNWRIKLAALLAATLIWYFIKHDLIAAGGAGGSYPPVRFSE